VHTQGATYRHCSVAVACHSFYSCSYTRVLISDTFCNEKPVSTWVMASVGVMLDEDYALSTVGSFFM
jgi:hypothetical protein